MIRGVTKTVRGRLSVFTLALVASLALTFGSSLEGLSTRGQYALATMVFAGILWMSGALPLTVTALSIPVLLTACGAYGDIDPALAGFADHLIFLFIAGSMLANAPQKYNVDRRITLWLMAVMGSSPRRLIPATMFVTALLLMWVSNTATTAMMTPIVLGVLMQMLGHEEVYKTDTAEGSLLNIQVAVFLGTVYAANVGGVGTLIGTPPNVAVTTQLNALPGYDIGFAEWPLAGLPVVATIPPIVWYLLASRFYPPKADDAEGAREQAREYLVDESALSTCGRRVAYILAVTVGLRALGGLNLASEGVLLDQAFNTLFGTVEGTIPLGAEGHQGLSYHVMIGMVSIPALVLADTMEWDEPVDIDWGTILLFGGGISLVDAFASTGAMWQLVETVFGSLIGASIVLVVGAIVLLVIFPMEMTSNTAVATITVPVLIGIGSVFAAMFGLTEVSVAVFLVVSRVIVASFVFTLPVATPPNAIIFGSGHIKQSHTMWAGAVLNAVMTGVLAILIWFLFQFAWSAFLWQSLRRPPIVAAALTAVSGYSTGVVSLRAFGADSSYPPAARSPPFLSDAI